MSKPSAIVNLLEELHNEAVVSDINVLPTTKAVLYLSPDAINEEDGLSLTGEECKLLFANTDTVERMLEALGYPSDASLSIFDLTLGQSVMDFVERRFVAVDEG
jgi:hypothetical protein